MLYEKDPQNKSKKRYLIIFFLSKKKSDRQVLLIAMIKYFLMSVYDYGLIYHVNYLLTWENIISYIK